MQTQKNEMAFLTPERSVDNKSDHMAIRGRGLLDNMKDMSCCFEVDSTPNDVLCEPIAGDRVEVGGHEKATPGDSKRQRETFS
jgi:hypothetical protein